MVSFHSLEDRIVKRFLRDASEARSGSRHLPVPETRAPLYAGVAKAVRASEVEIARNPRSRSSVLRSAIRTGAPAREAA